jgi:carbon-monoxide dehydrogenase medium subunit
MKVWKRYLLPNTLDEALTYLVKASGEARVVAGGTDLLLDIRHGRHPFVDTLVDITRIPELCEIHSHPSGIYLGSAVTHKEIVANSLLQKHATCLVKACGLIGGSQVRNVATIGGNVAHGLPAGDGTIALLALDAEVEIASEGGRRWESVEDLFLGPGEVVFDRTKEILVQFRFSFLEHGEKTDFHRIMRPQGVAIAILNMALWVSMDLDDLIKDLRLALGPSGPKPFRARRTEDLLRGQHLNEASLHQAIEMLLEETQLRTSKHRSTREYREHLLGILLRRFFSDQLD